MIPKNFYWQFESVISPEDCDKIIKYGQSKDLRRANTFGDEDGGTVRNSDVSWIGDDGVLLEKLNSFTAGANRSAGWNFDIQHGAENIQFTEYKLGQYYDWHNDGQGDTPNVYRRDIPGISELPEEVPRGYNKAHVGMMRKLSVVVQLSDPKTYKGGTLQIRCPESLAVFEPTNKQGSIIVFPSFMIHRVRPVTKGVRHSAVIWHLGRPFR